MRIFYLFLTMLLFSYGNLMAAEIEVSTLTGLQDAVKQTGATAGAGDVVRITENITVSSMIEIYQSVTITANAGVILTYTNTADKPMFVMHEASTTFSGLTIEDGRESGNQTAIEVGLGTASIENCTFNNWKNTSATSQGVVCVKGSGTLTSINGATFSNCNVGSDRGLIFLGKSGVTFSGAITFTGCTGYEIYNEGYNFTEGSDLTISGSTDNKLHVACQRVPSGEHALFATNGTLDNYAITKLFTDTNNAWHLIQYGSNVVFSAPIMVQNGNDKTYYPATALATATTAAADGSSIHIYEDCAVSGSIGITGKTLTFEGHDNATITRSAADQYVLFYNGEGGNATYNNLTIIGISGNTSPAIEAVRGSATIYNCTFQNWYGGTKGVVNVDGNGTTSGTVTINGGTFDNCNVGANGLIYVDSQNLTLSGNILFTDNTCGAAVYDINKKGFTESYLSTEAISIKLGSAPTIDATTLVYGGTLSKYALVGVDTYTGWLVRQNGNNVEVGKAYIKVTNGLTDTYLDDLYDAVNTVAETGATVTVLKNYTLGRTIGPNKSMTITTANNAVITRGSTLSGVVFACNTADATIDLSNITIDGDGTNINDKTVAAVDCSNGTINLNDVTIQNWVNCEVYGVSQGIVACKGNGTVNITNTDLSGNTVSNWAGLVFAGNNNLTLRAGNTIPSTDNSTTENPTYGTSSIYIEQGHYITTTVVPTNNLQLALAPDYYERSVVKSENYVSAKFSLSKDTELRFASLQEVSVGSAWDLSHSGHDLGVTGDHCVKNETLNRYYTDLASAINDASDNQTLTILKDCKISSPADMGKTLTINNGIDAVSGDYFVVSLCESDNYRQNGKSSPIPFYGSDASGDITFNNVIFDGDDQPHNSAFAEMAQGKVTFNNCTFQNIINNYGEAEGEDTGDSQGIICCKNHHVDEHNQQVGGTVIINGCTFKDNKVNDGHGILFIGNSHMTVKGCTTFTGNSWRDSNGNDIAESTAYDIFLEQSYVNLKNETLDDLTWATPITIWIKSPTESYTFLSCKAEDKVRNNRAILTAGKFTVMNPNWYQYVPCSEKDRVGTNDWKYSFHNNDVCITAPVSASLAESITSSGIPYTTFCAKYDAKVPTGLKAWRAISENGVLATFQAIEDGVIPGYEGVVLTHDTYHGPDTEAEDTGDAFSDVIETNNTAVDKFKLSENICRGSVAAYTTNQTDYYYYTMSKSQTISRGRLTYTLYTGSSLPANKSFFRIAKTDEDGKSNYGKFAFAFDLTGFETTGIDNLRGLQNLDQDTWYTINGVKLNAEPTQRGIYIKNNKKYIIK